MAFTVTTLIENYAQNSQLHAEHALSLYITDGSYSLLLDTGASGAFLDNAKQLGVDLTNLNTLVLSHGHFDHTGGVKALFESGIVPQEIYLGQNFFAPRYRRQTGRLRPIGSRISEEYLFDKRVNFYLLEPGVFQLTERVYLLSGIPNKSGIEPSNPDLLRRQNEAYVMDDFSEETIVVIRGEQGLAVLSGCSHIGVINTCLHVSEVFGEPVHTFIGGTHLMEADESRINKTMDTLRILGLKRLGACHCNGERANTMFAQEFDGFFSNNAGVSTRL